MRSWIGVEIDGVLAKNTVDISIGRPIKNMIEKVKDILNMGYVDIKIFTRRVSPIMADLYGDDYMSKQIEQIHKFCKENFGVQLPITSQIDPFCNSIWDTKVNQVLYNQGVFLSDALDKLTKGGPK